MPRTQEVITEASESKINAILCRTLSLEKVTGKAESKTEKEQKRVKDWIRTVLKLLLR